MLDGGLGHLLPCEHSRDLGNAFRAQKLANHGDRAPAALPLLRLEVPGGQGGNLRDVRHAKHLIVLGEQTELATDPAALTPVRMVEPRP